MNETPRSLSVRIRVKSSRISCSVRGACSGAAAIAVRESCCAFWLMVIPSNDYVGERAGARPPSVLGEACSTVLPMVAVQQALGAGTGSNAGRSMRPAGPCM